APLCGIGFENISKVLGVALKKNKNLKTVIMNFDAELISSDASSDIYELPWHLYDSNVFNDVKYVLNKSILIEKIGKVLIKTSKKEKTDSLDDVYLSSNQYYLREFAILSDAKDIVMTEKPTAPSDVKNYNLRFFDANMNSFIKDIAEKYQGVEFYLFIPPKSIVYLRERYESGYTDTMLSVYQKAFEMLSAYKNVRMFCFQTERDMIGNLYNYVDSQHFSPLVSDKITEKMSKGEGLLTKENYMSELSKIKTLTEEFDYSVFSSEAYPIKGETDLSDYLDIISDERYIVSVALKNDDGKTDTTPGITYPFISNSVFKNGVYKGNTAFISENKDGILTYHVNGMTFEISGGENDGECRITIDGVDYSLDLDGLNIVVCDTLLGRVIDSVNFSGVNYCDAARTRNRRRS
nr:hypothetical protein [Clostridiales bacterium]